MKSDVPWVTLVWSLYGNTIPHAQSTRGSFWWWDIFNLVDDYKSITHCNVGRRDTILFWKDLWSNGDLLCDQFPWLFSFALNEDVSVAALCSTTDLASCFALPLLVEAFSEFQQVSQLLLDTPIDATLLDQRIFAWGSSH